MREIIFDTETTGLDPLNGDRVVEIGCIEVINHIATGQTFHVYINPERDMPDAAFRVHGLSAEFLSKHKKFEEIADEFVAFVGEDAKLVAHNGTFDIGFLNAELERCGRPILARERLVDTLVLARRRHGFASNKLDDLCARYGIDNSRRTKHGALLDAELLAEVYAELMGGRQASFGLAIADEPRAKRGEEIAVAVRPEPLAPRLTEGDVAAHRSFITNLGEAALWWSYEPQTTPAE
jgi:DNA polymerase III subunit epsilon